MGCGTDAGVRLRTTDDPAQAVSGAAVVITALSIGLTGVELDPAWVRDDALLLPLDYATSVGTELARSALLAADDVTAFAAVRAQRKLGDYPEPAAWTGQAADRWPTGRASRQNLGNGLNDLVVAERGGPARRDSGTGHVLAGGHRRVFA